MSRIGRSPVEIKEGVSLSLDKGVLAVSGAKGNLSYALPEGIEVTIKENKVTVYLKEKEKRRNKKLQSLFGLTRATILNMVKGVSEGFEKRLVLTGVGYRAALSGNDLVLSLGFSHPVKISSAEGIKFSVSENVVTVSGFDKRLVGDIADKIQRVRPPDPYKGKGISYEGQKIRKKAGKAAKAVGAKA